MEDKLLVNPAPDFISALATALGKQPAAIEHVARRPTPAAQRPDGRIEHLAKIYAFPAKIHAFASENVSETICT